MEKLKKYNINIQCNITCPIEAYSLEEAVDIAWDIWDETEPKVVAYNSSGVPIYDSNTKT